MANSYTQILIQFVFAVQDRTYLIGEKHRNTIEKYICGIVTKKKSKPLAIYCNPDHTHLLVGLNPVTSVSEMVRDVKSSSSKWINEGNWFVGKFSWQEGYGAFSYSRSQLDYVVKYIRGQKEHHKRTTFKEEYLKLLKESEILFEDQYLFEWI